MPTNFFTQTYKPAMLVGQVYAKPYGGAGGLLPIGNVLELSLEHKEDVQTQEDMSRLGGGTHAEVRRVTEVGVKMKLADLNLTNISRALLGTGGNVTGGTATDEAHVAALGGLCVLAHLSPTAVVVKKGATAGAATTVTMAGNYEVRPEGVWVLPDAVGITAGDKLWITYTYADYATVEALTAKSAELELVYGGLNEADSGKPVRVELFRCSQGITKSLALLSGKGFGALEVEGAVLLDATKTGQGVSRYYRVSMQ